MTNRDLESAKQYHRSRAQEESCKALDADHPHARVSHEKLSELHTQACRQLDGIAVLGTDVRSRVD